MNFNNADLEKKICDKLLEAISMVKAGSSPNDALIKVAKEAKLSPGSIQVMAHAYNSGRTNNQRSNNSELFDKLASFELADPAAIVLAVYPAETKTAAVRQRETAVSKDYSQDANWLDGFRHAQQTFQVEKAASVVAEKVWTELDERLWLKKLDGAMDRIKIARQQYRDRLLDTWNSLTSNFDNLREYFHIAGSQPFSAVQKNAEAMYGSAATALLARLKNKVPDMPEIKSASLDVKPVYRTQAPYTYIAAAIGAIREHNSILKEACEFEREATTKSIELIRLVRREKSASKPVYFPTLKRQAGEPAAEKRAFVGTLGTGAMIGAGAEAGRSILDKVLPKSEEKLKEKALEEISDPSHESKLRAIRAEAALHSVLNGPYFEGEDPVKVTNLFNNLIRLSPRAADQPLLLEATLRRLAAQGSADPHDVSQLLDIETKIKKRDMPVTAARVTDEA